MSRIGERRDSRSAGAVAIPKAGSASRGTKCGPKAPRVNWRSAVPTGLISRSPTARRDRRAGDERQVARAARADSRAGGEHGHRREGRLRAQARHRRHRLPGPDAGQEHQLALGYSHPIDVPAAGGRHGRDRQADGDHPARARTRPCWARRRPSSARCASPTPTRARASSTPDEVIRRKVGKKAGAK